MKLKDIGFKFLLLLFALVPLAGCNNSRMDFEVALQHMEPGGRLGRKALVTSLDEWEDLDLASTMTSPTLIKKYNELAYRYDELFFTNNAVIMFSFGLANSGGRFNKIQLSRDSNELVLEVIVEKGVLNVTAFGIIILEISNENISEITTLNVNLNVLDANIPG